MHVPKTAGSTVNRILKFCSYSGREQCQIITAPDLIKYALHGDWLSGHLSKDVFEAGFAGLDRAREYFSTVRRPVAQLVSYLNWQFELSRQGRVVGNHGDAVDVRATNFSNPMSIVALLDKHADAFLNVQSRYLIGPDFATISQGEFLRRLSSYSFIAREDNLPNLYRAFGFPKLPNELEGLRENVTPPHFDASGFDSPIVHEFLAQRHAHDLRLYDAVGEITWSAEARNPFRTFEFGCVCISPESSDEQRYLDANPDVVDAIKLGHIASGHEHYDVYGRTEHRLMRSGAVDEFFSRETREFAPTFQSTGFEFPRATRENFDEQGYLDANPDVADAVLRGQFPSGRAHFELHGHSEGRLIRPAVGWKDGAVQ